MSRALVDATAVISSQARMADDVSVGPYAVIDGPVTVGVGTRIGPHVHLTGRTQIGRQCQIFTGAVIGSPSQDKKHDGQESAVIIGDHNTIREYVTINAATFTNGQTRVGDHNLIMAYVHIAHDCQIGSHTVIANAVTMGGHVQVQDHVVLGGMVGIHQFVRIGRLAILGGCTKTVMDVSPYAMVDGNPAKLYGLNKVGLERAEITPEAQQSLKEAYRVLFRSGLTLADAVSKIRDTSPRPVELDHLLTFLETAQRGITR